MKTSSRKSRLLGAACGLILVAAASSTTAQTPLGTKPGTVQSPTPTQTTPNPAPTQTVPNPAPTQTIPNPSPTPTLPNPAPIPGTPSLAQPDATANRPTTVLPMPNQFTSLDRNRDTRITVEEYTGATLAAFQSIDRNRDGRISDVELAEAQPADAGTSSPLSPTPLTNADASIRAAEMFKSLDVNRDGFVSQKELDGVSDKVDKEADTNSRNTDTTDAGVNRGR